MVSLTTVRELVLLLDCSCDTPPNLGYLNKDHNGLADVFCTTGVRHLKFWSFIRPVHQKGSETTLPLTMKTGTMGKVTPCFPPCPYLPPSPSDICKSSKDLSLFPLYPNSLLHFVLYLHTSSFFLTLIHLSIHPL